MVEAILFGLMAMWLSIAIPFILFGMRGEPWVFKLNDLKPKHPDEKDDD